MIIIVVIILILYLLLYFFLLCNICNVRYVIIVRYRVRKLFSYIFKFGLKVSPRPNKLFNQSIKMHYTYNPKQMFYSIRVLVLFDIKKILKKNQQY